MYKVFVNDKPIILTDSLNKEKDFLVYTYKDINIDEIFYKLRKETIKGAILYCIDVQKVWKTFLKNFIIVSAAGGLVLNTKKEILFIYRSKKWDLPKGRIEKGESIEKTAIREVEEECGVSNLIIDKFLLKTYHLFYQKGKRKLKETSWFLMHTDFEEKPIPQTEEGITKAVFKDAISTKKALEKTYTNITLVFNEFAKNS